MKPLRKRKRIMPAFWRTHRITPIPASVPIAATARPARSESTSPWSINSMTWPSCSRRFPPRSGRITKAFPPMLRTASPAAAVRPAVPSAFRWWNGWQRQRSCLERPDGSSYHGQKTAGRNVFSARLIVPSTTFASILEADFSNSNYFSLVFHRLTGTSPREFRRKAALRGNTHW